MIETMAPPARPRRYPPPLAPNPEFPVRPAYGFLGRTSFRLLGRGISPGNLAPLMTWMLANGATDGNDIERIRLAFSNQLGPSWRSFAEASVITKVLLLRTAASFHDSELLGHMDADLMKMMAAPVSLPSDMAVLRAFAKRYGGDRKLVGWIDGFAVRHGFERTVLIGLVRYVLHKKGMVRLASRDMPWLPFVDRASWIAIHFCGRRHFAAECAGVYSHLAAEEAAGEAIRGPRVTDAIEGMRSAWRERVVYDPREGEYVLAEGLRS